MSLCHSQPATTLANMLSSTLRHAVGRLPDTIWTFFTRLTSSQPTHSAFSPDFKIAEDDTSALSTSLFGRLPCELRNKIWRFLLLRADSIDITDTRLLNEPVILATCRQIRDEGIGIYYAENTFRFELMGHLGSDFHDR